MMVVSPILANSAVCTVIVRTGEVSGAWKRWSSSFVCDNVFWPRMLNPFLVRAPLRDDAGDAVRLFWPAGDARAQRRGRGTLAAIG